MEVLDLIKKYKYQLFITINLLWIWALLSPNIYYFDDSYRAAGGYYNWGGDFRPFSDWLYYTIGMGRNFTDLTPLPQILALGFLYSIYFLYLKNFTHKKMTLTNLVVFIPIIWSPFLLSNLYFRYDSIFMLLAVLLSVLAIFEVNHKKYIRAILLLFVALGFYQPAIVAYVCTALFIIYKIEQENKKSIFKLWFKKSAIYFSVFLVAILLYYFLVMKFTTDYNFYSATHSQMAIKNFIPNIIQTIKEISILFHGDTGSIYLAIFFYLVLLNLIFLIQKVSYFGLLIFIVTHLSFIISAVGVNLLLDVPRFEYRTFIFYGFYISYLLLGTSQLINQANYKKYLYMILFFVTFYFYSIALNVSNAQKSKKDFEDSVMINLVQDLYEIDNCNDCYYVFLGEYNPYIVHRLIDKYPVIMKIVSSSGYYIYKMQNYFPVQLKYRKFVNDIDKYNFFEKNVNLYEILKQDKFYTIYGNGENIIIYFKSDGGYR